MRSTLRTAAMLLVITCSVVGNGAELFNAPHLLPPSSFCVLSIPDCPQTWTRIKTTAIYREYQALMANPVVTNNIHYKEFDLKKRKWELKAGFPLSLDAIAGQMLSGIDLAVMAPSSLGAPLSALVIIEMRDLVKVQKILSLLEQQAAPPADKTPGVTPSPTPQDPMYKTVAIKTMPNSELQYTLVGKYLIISNSGAHIRETIDRTKGDLKTTLTTSPEFAPLFAKAMKGLKPTTHDLFYVVDNSKITKALMQMLPGMALITGSSAMKMVSKTCNVGSVNIRTNSITFNSYTPFSADQSDPMQQLIRKYPPQSLASLRYMPQGTFLCSASNLFDGPIFYDMYYSMFAWMGSMGGFPGMKNTQADLDTKIAEIENTLGFKLKDDLAASLGPEFCFAMNNVTFPSFFPIPTIDIAFIFQVKDRSKMTMIMQKLEQLIQKQLGSRSGPSGQPSAGQPAFQITTHNGVTIRFLPFPDPFNYSLCYAFDGPFLLLETTVENMKNLLNVKAGTSQGVVKDAEFQALMQQLPEKQNQFLYVAITNILRMIKTITIRQFGASPPDQVKIPLAIMDALTSLRMCVVTTSSDASGVVNQGILLMK